MQVFSGSTFYPMASLTSTVPILSVGGIAKEFLVPGWRVGWVIVYDAHGAFAGVRAPSWPRCCIACSCSRVCVWLGLRAMG